MMSQVIRSLFTLSVLLVVSITASAQTTGGSKLFEKNGLSFEYPAGWSLKDDDQNADAQQLNLSRADSDLSINIFVHKGKITPEKMADAKKSFIDPLIAAYTKQFVQGGLKPEQTAIETEIGGVKAEGTKVGITGTDAGGASIYWALVGQRVVILTLFGPDSDAKKLASSWDLVRTTLKIVDPKAAASPKP
jgi:hypothetical protein